MFRGDFRQGLPLAHGQRDVRLGEPRVKTFGGQVCDFERMSGIDGGNSFGDLSRHRVGQRRGIGMCNND
jgi:hypothetical protein